MNASGKTAERQVQSVSEKMEILGSFFDLRAKLIYNRSNGGEDIREKLLTLREKLACTMITYPNDNFVRVYVGRIDDLLRFCHNAEPGCPGKHGN